jgi:hypothetical protein
MDLAYNYYKGDIIDSSNKIIQIQNLEKSSYVIKDLITTRDDKTGEQNESMTMAKIKTSFNKFTTHPANTARYDTYVGQFATANAGSATGAGLVNGRVAPVTNYSSEYVNPASARVYEVSTLDRESLLFEKDTDFPIMFFPEKGRHDYREAYAKFENGTAYFVGLKKIVFQREDHVTKSANQLYAYGVGESDASIEHNDFTLVENDKWSAE